VVAAIVLAAGESRRMGMSKPLLPLGETTFLGHLLANLRRSRAEPLVVVLGHEAERVKREVSLQGVSWVENPRYREGMLSSVEAGLRTLRDVPADAALLFPVDHPRVGAALVDALIEAFERTGAPVIIPRMRGRRGHPVLFARSLWPELATAPPSVGARQVVWDHAREVLEVPTDDQGVVDDIDTPELYRSLVDES
jgi:molybdenum cofactor cytidylyltransferase